MLVHLGEGATANALSLFSMRGEDAIPMDVP